MENGLIHKSPINSNVAFILSFPPHEEVVYNACLNSGLGSYLNSLVQKAGFILTNHHIIYAYEKAVPSCEIKSIRYDDLLEEKQNFYQKLTNLYTSGVTTLIPMGELALNFTCGVNKIENYRGTLIPANKFPSMKCIPTFDTRYLYNTDGNMEPILVRDVHFAMQESKIKGIHFPEQKITIFNDIRKTEKFFSDVSGITAPVAADIETNGKAIMTAYGVATSKTEAFVVPYDFLKIPTVLRSIARFANSGTPLIFHNAGFDCLHNAYYYRIFNRNIFFDTMLAQHSCYPTLPKGLGFCSSLYTKAPYWKDEGKNAFAAFKNRTAVDWETFYNYNGKDCCNTYAIYEGLEKELDDCGVRNIFNLAMTLLDPALFAMYRGMGVSQDAVKYMQSRQDVALKILNDLSEKMFEGVNLNSPAQLKKLLYEDWKLPPQYKDKKLTADGKKLERLEAMNTSYKLRLGLLQMTRKYRKAGSFYTYPTNPDGRFRYEAKIAGTDTGRWATSKSMTGSGQNIQNFPKFARCVFTPSPGFIYLQGDLSQVEARIVAALTGDLDWVHAFDLMDLHSDVASFLFGIPIEQVNKKTHRQIAKRVAHASHYKLGKNLLSEILKVPVAEAQRLLEAYYLKRPLLAPWHVRVEEKIRKDHYVQTCYGRKIHYFGPVTDAVVRAAVAAEPQSTGAQYLNTALSQFYKIPDYRFCNQVHDSTLSEIPNNLDKLSSVMRQMKEIAEVPITVNGITLTVPMDFEIGFDWYNMVEVKDVNDKSSIEAAYSTAVKKREEFERKILDNAIARKL